MINHPATRCLDCLVISAGLEIVASGTEPPVVAVAFTPDGDSVVACSQSGLQVLSWPQLERQANIKVSAANLHDVAIAPSGDRLAVAGGNPSEEGTIELLSWPDGKSLQNLEGHDDSIMAVRWRGDSKLASASLDHSVVIWDTDNGTRVQSLRGHSRGVLSLCFLPAGQTLVTAGIDQSLRVWDVDSGQLQRSLNLHTLPVHDLAVCPGEHALPLVASAGEDKTVRIWQPTIGRMVRFARLTSKPLDIEWLPDGSRVVAACADGHIRLIDPLTVSVTQDIAAIEGWAYSLSAHPTDGSLVVGGSEGQILQITPAAPAP